MRDKIVTIEKLDSAILRQQKLPYTINMNYVLQNVTNVVALGIWVYLTSLPDDWRVYRSQLMSHFGLGRDKIGNALKFLNQNHLIQYVQERTESGVFHEGYILVKNGFEFEEAHRTALLKNRTTDFPDSGKTAPTNTINNTNTTKNLKIYCASDVAREKNEQEPVVYEPIPIERIKNPPMLDKPIATDEKRRELIERKAHGDFKLSPDEWYEREQKLIWFEMFWESYPKKRDKVAARKSWEKNKLEAIGEKIVADVLDRSQRDVQWQDKQFIPYPATYLNHQRWTDEIITKQKGTPKNDNQQPRNESPSASGARILENGFRKYFGNGKLT